MGKWKGGRDELIFIKTERQANRQIYRHGQAGK